MDIGDSGKVKINYLLSTKNDYSSSEHDNNMQILFNPIHVQRDETSSDT